MDDLDQNSQNLPLFDDKNLNQPNIPSNLNNLNLNTPYQSPNINISNLANISNKQSKLNPTYKKKHKSERLSPTRKLAIKSLVQSDMSISEIGRQENVSMQTIYNVLNDPKLELLGTKQIEKLKSHIISKAYSNSYHAQSAVNDDKLEKSSFMQLMIGSKIAIEQARLLEEKSTSNIAIKSLNEAIHSEIQSLTDRLKTIDNQLYQE
jgi:predicted DNA-binding protein YlxM (UPF0122 family)